MTTINESRDGTPPTGPVERPKWARRLAERRQHAHEADLAAGMRAETWAPIAAPLLWAMVDEAVEQANDALGRMGLLDLIAVDRAHHQYVLSLPGPDETQRTVTVFASVRAVDERAVGSASISTSETRARIDLTPTAAGERVHWLVATTGIEFTARVLDDLLLSVFGNDPSATGRLGSLYSIDQDG